MRRPSRRTVADVDSGRAIWSPWRTIVGFGVVSLAADMVYEGARSVYGPLLGALGASALVVGAVTGAGEAVALILRLFSGRLADRTGRYWSLTIIGYVLTAVCVPLLALTPALGTAGLAAATLLILAERFGKAIRSPAKSVLLADAAGQVGMGRGLGAHKALDQVGAFAGPVLVAALTATAALAVTGLQVALTALIIPGVIAVVLLIVLRRRAPSVEPARPEQSPVGARQGRHQRGREALPAAFWRLAVGAALCSTGLVTFGLIGFHLVQRAIVPVAGVPLLYAGAMAAGAVAALGTGWAYDRFGGRTLLALPFIAATVAPLALGGSFPIILLGVLLWGVAVGVQDSTVKALVADQVPRERRATAYGTFAAVQGAGALVGGLLTGALYQHSLVALVTGTVVVQMLAVPLLVLATRDRRPEQPSTDRPR